MHGDLPREGPVLGAVEEQRVRVVSGYSRAVELLEGAILPYLDDPRPIGGQQDHAAQMTVLRGLGEALYDLPHAVELAVFRSRHVVHAGVTEMHADE